MDATDMKVLDLLQHDAALPQAEIARRVGLSPASVNERIKKLERQGVIRRYAAILDDTKVGLGITAFVEVFMEHPKHERSFVDLMGKLPEVMECHYVTGEYSCLLKVRVADRQALRMLVLDRINALSGVRQTRTLIVLETAKETPAMAVPGAPSWDKARRGFTPRRAVGGSGGHVRSAGPEARAPQRPPRREKEKVS